jgi:hypothetical protein
MPISRILSLRLPLALVVSRSRNYWAFALTDAEVAAVHSLRFCQLAFKLYSVALRLCSRVEEGTGRLALFPSPRVKIHRESLYNHNETPLYFILPEHAAAARGDYLSSMVVTVRP